MGEKTYTFLNDFVFKYAFGREKNERLLICLLNALLQLENEDRIQELQILNPFNLKEFADSKLSIVDVKAVDGRKRRYNIEIQVNPQAWFIPRALYYLGKLYTDQISEGEAFSSLNKATSISILEFTLFPNNPELQNMFRFKNARTHEELTDALEVHFLELPKFGKEKPRQLRTPFERWLHILKFGTRYGIDRQLPAELSNEEGVDMAIAELQKVNSDREMRQLIEAREKARHDEATRFADAELRGRVLGLAEGIEKGLKEGVKKGLQEGIEKGLKEGIEKGLQEGIEKGLQEGIEKGLQEGIEKGRREAREKMILLARRLLKVGTALTEIIEITGLTESEVLATGTNSSDKNKVQETARPFGRSRRKPAKS